MGAGKFPFSLSLVFLAYNEAENIPVTVPDGIAFLEAKLADWEVIVVDDGSTDASAEVVRGLMAGNHRLRMVQHGRNRGMGAGMQTGIEHATKDYIVFTAADGQVSPWELERLLDLLDRADIVLSTYETARESRYRTFLSKGLRLYMRALAGIKFELQGLYVFPMPLARKLLPKIQNETFFFSFELIQRAIEGGARVAHTTMTCRPRLHGESKVTGLKRIARVAEEVWKYRLRRLRE